MSGYDLVSAITFHDLATVQHLLSTNPSLLTFLTYDRKSLLHHACLHDSPKIAQHLLSLSPSLVSQKDSNNQTPINLARKHGNLRTLRLLSQLGYVDRNIDPVYAHGRDMMLASGYGPEGGVRRAVSVFGGWVNWRNYDGRCALHWAVCRGDVRVVQELLECGARGDVSDRWGVTPVMEARRVGGGVMKAFEEAW